MFVNPVNPIIKKTLSEFLQKDLEYSEQSFDSDDVVYQLLGDPENSRVLYSFRCNSADVILANGGQEMLEEEYGEFMMPRADWIPDFDVTLCISTEGFPKTQKVKKSMSDEQQEQVRQANEEIRTQRQARVDEIATKIAQFKRDFVGAPIRRALMQIRNNAAVTPCELAYRRDEKYWIASSAPGTGSFYFSFNFLNETDISMARVLLLEFKDSQRHVRGSIATAYHDKNAPAELTAAFPHVGRETYTNGIIQFTMTGVQLKAPKTITQPLGFLTSFRQYVQFHLHSMKQQLHKKMRLRVEAFERVIVQARRDPIGTKNWKEQHIGIGEADRELEEEKKVEEVFVHTRK